VKPLLPALVALALVLLGVPYSGASFNDTSSSLSSIAADSVTNYLGLWSQSTDPAKLTGYATKRSSNPLVPAATGADSSLAVALGAYRNTEATIARVLTLQARTPLPGSITVSATLAADAATGQQPITGVSFSPTSGSPAGSTVTLTQGQKAQLNLTVRTRNLPGNNVLFEPKVRLTVRYSGYSGAFLTYTVPVGIWDGNGAGP
jgi:hypothetical protein